MHHIVPRPPACKPSNSDKSGRLRAAAGKQRAYRHEALESQAIATAKQAIHLALQIRQGRIESWEPGIDDDGALRTQPIEPQADGLAKPPFEAITHHRWAQFARHRETDSRTGALRLPNEKGGE
jgi:hypothetical protein